MIEGYKNISLQKNVKITESFLRKNEKEMKELLEYFINYPDRFIDIITPSHSSFKLFFFQRITLRAAMRYRYLFITAPRAFSKTFICVLAGILKCMFLPGEKFFQCLPGKGQGLSVCSEKINEIFSLFPILEKELTKKNMSTDQVTLVFKNGSMFDVVGSLNSSRGGRRHGGIIDEVRKNCAHKTILIAGNSLKDNPQQSLKRGMFNDYNYQVIVNGWCALA